MSFRWIVPPRVVFNGARVQDVYEERVARVLTYAAPQIEAEAKRNAPWTDRTGNARQTLGAFVYRPERGIVALVLRQYMDYGLWLEVKNGGRYAIVLPTLENWYSAVWSDVRGVV